MLHFIDVGANVGQTFDDYITKHSEYDGCTVWCLEPSPRSVPMLMDKANFYSNRYAINVCPFGLRGESGTLPFFMMSTGSPADSFEQTVGPVMTYGFSLQVYAQDVVEFIRLHTSNTDKIVLKLDCEGSEYSILRRLLDSPVLERVQKVMVEFHKIGIDDFCKAVQENLEKSYALEGIILEPWMF